MKQQTKPRTRSYSDRTLKLLWGRAAGRCSVPACRVELYVEKTEYDPEVPIGDIAHVCAHGDSGPRVDATLSPRERNDYDNLILLCKNCHARLDGQKNTNTVEMIQELKHAHEAWVRASLPERGRSRVGWHTVFIEDQWPIDSLTFDAALSPDFMIASPKKISVSLNNMGWSGAARHLQQEIRSVLANGDLFEKRIAVFPLARVTSCLYAGYLLTSRPNIQLFQYHRDEQTWVWPTGRLPESDLKVSVAAGAAQENIIFMFELSANIDVAPLLSVTPDATLVRVSVPSPSTHWLQHPDQLRRLGFVARDVFEDALQRSSASTTWHLLYAGPAPGAIKVGQQLNPTMTPKTQLYEYTHPIHVPSLSITGQI